MDQNELFDLHDLSRKLDARNLKSCKWFKVKCVRAKKGIADAIEIKYDYTEEYQKVFIRSNTQQPARTSRRTSASRLHEVDESLLQPLPVSVSKKNDLLRLCTTGVIKTQFHQFYTDLPSSCSITDRLPEPDCSEQVADTEAEN